MPYDWLTDLLIVLLISQFIDQWINGSTDWLIEWSTAWLFIINNSIQLTAWLMDRIYWLIQFIERFSYWSIFVVTDDIESNCSSDVYNSTTTTNSIEAQQLFESKQSSEDCSKPEETKMLPYSKIEVVWQV